MYLFAVLLGTIPSKESLSGIPVFNEEGGRGKEKAKDDDKEGQKTDIADTSVSVAQQASTLMSLLSAQQNLGASSKTMRVWLGEGLGSLPKRVHERMLKWELMEMQDFRPRSTLSQSFADSDTQTLLALPGFELASPRRKPIDNIITWVQCFSRYTAAMAQQYPKCVPGFMSHMLTVLKAYNEAEFPGWREYDHAFRDKMASTGVKVWTGMDVSLYQEHCGTRPKQQRPTLTIRKDEIRGKRPASSRPWVCFLYNGDGCHLKGCKFPHLCEICRGNHPKRLCGAYSGKK